MPISDDQSRFVSPPVVWIVRHPRGASLVAAAVVLLIVAALIVALQPQPYISLGSSWGSGPNYYVSGPGYILIGGTLSNTGDADGYAVLNWFINDQMVQQVRYLVPAHETFAFMLSQPWYVLTVSSSYVTIVSVQHA